jgi:SAM-dependent methyltransferase
MRQALLGRQTTKFVPLPVERGQRGAQYKFDPKRPIREVPYVPTPEPIVRTMLEVADVNERDVVYDLGCGDGRIVVRAAERFGARGVGVDIDPRRIQECKTSALRAGVSDRVRFLEQSLFTVDVAEATVVALYLLPWMNAQLRPKLLAELRPGARVVAHMFPISQWPADRVVHLVDVGRKVHLWIVPAKINGRWQCAVRTPDGRLRHGTIELEQEFQTVLGTMRVGGRELPLESTELRGDRFSFTLHDPGGWGTATYYCRADGDTIRGAAKVATRGGELELRARHV